MSATTNNERVPWNERDEIALRVLGVLVGEYPGATVDELTRKAYQYTDVLRAIRLADLSTACPVACCLCPGCRGPVAEVRG
jgi:hypothetical protein